MRSLAALLALAALLGSASGCGGRSASTPGTHVRTRPGGEPKY